MVYLSSLIKKPFKITKEELLKVDGDVEKLLPNDFNPERKIKIEDSVNGKIEQTEYTLNAIKNGLHLNNSNNAILEKKIDDLINKVTENEEVINELNNIITTLTINVLNLERLALTKGILNG